MPFIIFCCFHTKICAKSGCRKFISHLQKESIFACVCKRLFSTKNTGENIRSPLRSFTNLHLRRTGTARIAPARKRGARIGAGRRSWQCDCIT